MVTIKRNASHLFRRQLLDQELDDLVRELVHVVLAFPLGHSWQVRADLSKRNPNLGLVSVITDHCLHLLDGNLAEGALNDGVGPVEVCDFNFGT